MYTTVTAEAVMEACNYFGIDLMTSALEADTDEGGDAKKKFDGKAIASKISEKVKGVIPTMLEKAKNLKDKVFGYVKKVFREKSNTEIEVNSKLLNEYKAAISLLSKSYPQISKSVKAIITGLMSGNDPAHTYLDIANADSEISKVISQYSTERLRATAKHGTTTTKVKISSLNDSAKLLEEIVSDIDLIIKGLEKAKSYAEAKFHNVITVSLRNIPKNLNAIARIASFAMSTTNLIIGSANETRNLNAFVKGKSETMAGATA